MNKEAIQNDKRAAWFDQFIATLRVHELELDTQTASSEVKELYDAVMSENIDEMAFVTKALSQKFFVRKIIFDYLKMLGQHIPLRLAFDFGDSEVLVWAEIPNDDGQMESNLVQAEAKINAKFHPYGFDMESMIVEECDGLKIPNHYKIFK